MSQESPKQSTRSAVLEAKLEASEAKLKIMELTQRIHNLEACIAEQAAILKENAALLIKQRLPNRPYLSSTAKLLIACRQGFKCKNPDGTCLLYKLGMGRSERICSRLIIFYPIPSLDSTAGTCTRCVLPVMPNEPGR